MHATYALLVDATERQQEEERVWCEFVRLMRIEDGLRFVLDNEMELHDAVMAGQLSLVGVRECASKHFDSMFAGSDS